MEFEELITVSQRAEYREIKRLLEEENVEFTEKSIPFTVSCSDPQPLAQFKTIFSVKPEDKNRAMSLYLEMCQKCQRERPTPSAVLQKIRETISGVIKGLTAGYHASPSDRTEDKGESHTNTRE